MKKATLIPKGLIPAVAYLRRSTDSQEASIPDQRAAVQQYADEHGYRIIREYVDDAISGDETAKRLDFQRMIADAEDSRDFTAILCWDQDRFGRFDSMEAGYWTYPLRQAGVRLVTVNDGPIDWDDFTGRVMYGLKQEGKHQFLQDLSRNVARGQLETAKAGGWIGGIPYGYLLEGERKRKRLALGDSAKVRIVERIFGEFIDGRSMNAIARGLNDDGIASSGNRGKPWRADAVKSILENPAYIGDFVSLRYAYGKYHSIREGRIVKSTGRGRKPESEWLTFRDHHPAIIDRETFAKAQAILAKGKRGRSNHPTPEENPYRLAGLLRCGKCGAPLWGMDSRKYCYYECSQRKYDGLAACEGTTVREDRVLLTIAEYLESWLGFEGEALGAAAHYGALTADDLPEAFAQVRKLLAPPAKPKRRDRERLAKQLAKITADLSKARANLVLLDAANIPAAQERIRELDEQRAELENDLAQSNPPTEQDVNRITLGVLNDLYSLAAACRVLAVPVDADWEVHGSLESAAPKAIRRFLANVSHITVHTTKSGSGTATRHTFDRGEIVLAAVGAVTSNGNPHLSG